jgi:WD40 repeat protein/serine/threonine protein kinase
VTTDDSAQYTLLARLADEFTDRYRRGERPCLQEYLDKYPELAEDIRQLFATMVEIERVKVDRCATEASAPARAAPALKQLGDFRIIREIGRGGMGVVYEAEQLSLGRHVALKMLPPNLRLDGRQQRRFEREAKAAAKLHHTNIVPVFGVGEDAGTSYYVMQYIHGLGLDLVLLELKQVHPRGKAAAPPRAAEARRDVSVADVARSLLTGKFETAADADDDSACRERPPAEIGSRPTPPAVSPGLPDALSLSSSSAVLPGQGNEVRKHLKKPTYYQSVTQIGVQVADALDYAHKQNVLHRDIKPSNLLLDTHGTVWVTDFGLAKADDQQNLTHTGDILGTLRYMSPEAFDGKTDARSDIYALGLTLYELLALRPAFDERDRPKLIKQVTTREAPLLRRLNSEVPRDLETIVHKAIDRDPSHRYQSAGELAADLQHFLDDEPITARRSSVAEQLVRSARRHKGVAWALAVVALLLVVIAAGSLVAAVYFREQEQESREMAKRNEELANEKGKLAVENEREADRAKRAKNDADLARDKAEEQERLARRRFYSSQIILASQALLANRPVRALELLESQRPWEGDEDLRTFDWYHLWHEIHRDRRRSFPGHAGGCFDLALSPDGRTLGTADGAGRIKLWDVANGALLKAWQAHQNSVTCLDFAPDGRQLASVAVDGQSKWWDSASGKELGTLFLGIATHALAWRKDGRTLVVGAEDGSIRFLDLPSRTVRRSFKPHDSRVTRMLLTPDDKLLVSSCAWGLGRGKTLIHDLTSWPPVPVTDLQGAYGLALAPDGRTLAVAKFNHVIGWDLLAARQLFRFDSHHGMVKGLAFSPDGKQLVTGCFEDRTLIWWDLATGRELTRRASGISVRDVLPLPGGSGWVVGGAGENVDLWNPGTTEDTILLSREPLRGNVHIAPDGKTLITGSVNLPPTLAATWASQMGLLGSSGGPGPLLALSEVVPERAGALRWDLPTGKLLRPLPRLGIPRALSANGNKLLLVPTLDGTTCDTIQVCDIASEKRLRTLSLPQREKGTVAISPNGKWVAASNSSPTQVWDLQAAKPGPRYSLSGSASNPDSAAFSPDSETLAVGQSDGSVKLWRMATGRLTDEFRHGPYSISSVAFSRGGTLLATADEAGTIRFWELGTRQLCGTVKGDVEILTMRFFPDDRVLACGKDNGTITLIDVKTRQEQMSVRAHPEGVDSLAVAPDGKTLVSASVLGQVRIWRTTHSAEATARRNPLDRDDPESPVALKERGDSLLAAGHDAQAEQSYRNAIERFARLAEQMPQNADHARWLAVSHTALADLLYDTGRRGEAVQEFFQALPGWDQTVATFPDNPEYHGERFRLAVEFLPLLEEAGFRDELERERQVVRAAVATDGVRCNEVARGLVRRPGVQPASAQRAVVLARAAVALSPDYGIWRHTLGVAHYRAGQWQDAANALQESVELSGGVGVASDAFFLAMAYGRQGNRELALKWFGLGRFWMERLEPTTADQDSVVAWSAAAAVLGAPQKASDPPAKSDMNRRQFLDLLLELMPGVAWAKNVNNNLDAAIHTKEAAKAPR